MNRLFSKGFTLIEIILFLAISSLMLLGVLLSSSSSVGQQRYNDTVNSLQSVLQDQYTETINTRNGTTSTTCGPTGKTSNRGQGDCVLLGKYITSSPDGKKLITYPIYGYQSSTPTGTDDLSILRSYTMLLLTSSGEDYPIEWGVSMQNASVSSATFTLAILRSPSSGVIRTFVSNTNSAALTNAALINSSAMQTDLLICLEFNDLTNIGSRKGVKVIAGSSSTSGVLFIGDNSGC